MGPKSFSRVSKSVHGHFKSATCTYYFCNILFLMCFNILHIKDGSCSDITKARNLKNDLGLPLVRKWLGKKIHKIYM